MRRETARALAAAEGLTLVMRDNNATGYMGVKIQPLNSYTGKRPYQAVLRENGKSKCLGTFKSAHAAALALARALGPAKSAAAADPHAAKQARPPMAADEARKLAAAEGLTLSTSSESNSGYTGVWRDPIYDSMFEARIVSKCDGKEKLIGYFRSAHEAALAYARAAASEESLVSVANCALSWAEATLDLGPFAGMAASAGSPSIA